MARTVAQCNEYIVGKLVTTFASQGVTITPTTWSQFNVLRLMCYTFAIAQALHEQLQDLAITKMQAIVDKSAAGSVKWLQAKILEFQYSSTVPQVITWDTDLFYWKYQTIDTSKRIITACSISQTIANYVNVKVAKGSTTLSALSAPELTYLQNDYVSAIGTAGITYTITSLAPDKLYLEGTIYYKGIYSAVIQSNVIDGINEWLRLLSLTNFDGTIKISDIEKFVLDIEGVNDVVFERISCRADSEGLFGGIDLVLAGDWINRKYNSVAGYLIEETTASNTFTDKLTFTAE